MISADGRWNTHAIFGVVGPLRVRRNLAVRVGSAWASAASWTIVVIRFPRYQQVATVGSVDAERELEWRTFALFPGRYMLAVRYYGWGERVELPDAEIDGEARVEARVVPPNTNDFYRELPARSHPFYLWLHFYVYPMLRYRRLLPLYDLQCFPVEWCQVRELQYRGRRSARRGFYLVRVQPLARSLDADPTSVRVSVVP